jgi:hypothetical protein
VRSILEYEAVCWSPHRGQVSALNWVWKRATNFANNINEWGWETLVPSRLNKWSDVKCSDVEWTGGDLCEVILYWSKVKWATVNHGDKSTMYIRVTLYSIVLWLFHLVCILYCGYFHWLCNVCVCVCVLVICVVVFSAFCMVCTLFFVLFRLCIFILIWFVCTGVRTTATEWQLFVLVYGLLPPSDNSIAVNNNNNNNSNLNITNIWGAW